MKLLICVRLCDLFCKVCGVRETHSVQNDADVHSAVVWEVWRLTDEDV